MSQIINPANAQEFLQSINAPGGMTTLAVPNQRVQCLTNQGAVGVTLPLSATLPVGTAVVIIDTGNNAAVNPITIGGNGTNIDGAASLVLNLSGSLAVLMFDEGQWRRVSTERSIDSSDKTFEWVSEIVTPDESSDGLAVANAAALTALDVGQEPAGSHRFVLSFRNYFTYVASSTATVDGVTVIASNTGVGRWLRVIAGDPVWTNQLNWDVDSAAGNDENSGIAGSGFPLKTVAEFCRRVRVAPAGNTYTVNISAAGLPATDVIRFVPSYTPPGLGGATLSLVGATTNAVSSSFTASSASVPATNTQASITDATVTWAAQIGQILTATSGAANGAVAVALKDLGAGAVRVSDWVFPATGVFSATPAAADTYVIKTLPTVLCGIGQQGFPVRSNVNSTNLNFTTTAIAGVGNMNFFGCRISTTLAPQIDAFNQCFFFGCSVAFASTTLFVNCVRPLVQFFGGGFVNAILAVAGLGAIVLRSTLQASVIRWSAVSNVFGGAFTIASATGIFDCPAGNSAVQLRHNSQLNIQSTAGVTGLYGSGNALFGVDLAEGSLFSMPTTITPTITGASGDFTFDGMTTAYQQLELHTGALGAAVVVPLTTWANLVAAVVLNVSGFARNVASYKTGARFQTLT